MVIGRHKDIQRQKTNPKKFFPILPKNNDPTSSIPYTLRWRSLKLPISNADHVVITATANRQITPGTIPRVSKADGMDSTPSPSWVFISRAMVPYTPTWNTDVSTFRCQIFSEYKTTYITVVGTSFWNISKDIVVNCCLAGFTYVLDLIFSRVGFVVVFTHTSYAHCGVWVCECNLSKNRRIDGWRKWSPRSLPLILKYALTWALCLPCPALCFHTCCCLHLDPGSSPSAVE